MATVNETTSAPKNPVPASAVQPTGVTKAQADENVRAAKEGDAKLYNADNEKNRKTDPVTGRPLLEVEMKKPTGAPNQNLEAAPTKDAAEEKKPKSDEKAPVTTVAQLRDRGIEEGVMPTSSQVEEMRKLETEGLEELSKKIRRPSSETK